MVRKEYDHEANAADTSLLEDKLKNATASSGAEDKPKKKGETPPSTALDRFNIQSKQFKRIGVDMWDQIDNDIEKITGDILKDKISKKDLFNEAMEIGFPLWLKKHGMTDLLEKYKK